MLISSFAPEDVAAPELDEASVQPNRGPPDGAVDDVRAALILMHDRDRIAHDMNDRVIHRLFGAGLALQSARQMMDGHPADRKVQEAIDELDLVIRDIRDVLFDHRRPRSPFSESPD
jgi:signal transduction histidine kinase